MMQIDNSTMKTVERVARERDCSAEQVMRDAVSEYAEKHDTGAPPDAHSNFSAPESELPLILSMPYSSRPVAIHIESRSTPSPEPILPDIEETK